MQKFLSVKDIFVQTTLYIYEVLNPLKTELQFTLYNICVMLFFPFFHLSAERFIFDEKKMISSKQSHFT